MTELLALHEDTDNVVRWWGTAMSNRQVFKRGTEAPSSFQWTDSLWPEIQAASGCQTLQYVDTHCCPQQKERGKTAVKAFVNTKFAVHLCFSSYWMHKQTLQWGTKRYTWEKVIYKSFTNIQSISIHTFNQFSLKSWHSSGMNTRYNNAALMYKMLYKARQPVTM